MKPHVVVDIGNTRIKWGLVDPHGSTLLATDSLPDDPSAWQTAIDCWRSLPRYREMTTPLTWVVASVNPPRTERLAAWITQRGDHFFHLSQASQLPLRVEVENPDHVGIDRLLSAVAVTRTEAPGRGSVLIGAGTAVTVDWLDERHVYQGGSIFPDVDLMARALNDYTALLPRVALELPIPALPAKATIPAMQAGIFLAVSGGIREAVRLYTERARVIPRIYFSGGQAPLLVAAMELDRQPAPPWNDYRLWPNQTLVGILLSAEALPCTKPAHLC
jgi:type III pantothenate kinase